MLEFELFFSEYIVCLKTPFGSFVDEKIQPAYGTPHGCVGANYQLPLAMLLTQSICEFLKQ